MDVNESKLARAIVDDYLKIYKILPSIDLNELRKFYKKNLQLKAPERIYFFLNDYFKNQESRKVKQSEIIDINAIFPTVSFTKIHNYFLECSDVTNKKEFVVKQLLKEIFNEKKYLSKENNNQEHLHTKIEATETAFSAFQDNIPTTTSLNSEQLPLTLPFHNYNFNKQHKAPTATVTSNTVPTAENTFDFGFEPPLEYNEEPLLVNINDNNPPVYQWKANTTNLIAQPESNTTNIFRIKRRAGPRFTFDENIVENTPILDLPILQFKPEIVNVPLLSSPVSEETKYFAKEFLNTNIKVDAELVPKKEKNISEHNPEVNNPQIVQNFQSLERLGSNKDFDETNVSQPNPNLNIFGTDLEINRKQEEMEALNAIITFLLDEKKLVAEQVVDQAAALNDNANDLNKTSTITISDEDANDYENEAAALPLVIEEEVDDKLYYSLMEIFPEADSEYLRGVCKGQKNTPANTNRLISEILSFDYPKRIAHIASPERQLDAEEQFEILQQILPDADPVFLRLKVDELLNKPDELKIFTSDSLEKKDYPKLKDYRRKQQLSAQTKQYTEEFSVENFLEVIPDPETYFSDKDRKNNKLDTYSEHYASIFLKNRFPLIHVATINNLILKNDYNLVKICDALQKLVQSHVTMKSKRKPYQVKVTTQNIPLLQEIAYITHRTEIRNYLIEKKRLKEEQRNEARRNGSLIVCSCCFDDEVLPEDTGMCENGCQFCKDCIQKSVEIAFAEGKLIFSCLNSCDSHFTIQTLQAALKPKLFSIIAQKKQLEEVKAAGIEELESCPFCDFATIPVPGDKLFRCLNQDCMKESCRACKEPSHIPLRCNEVEKDSDVKVRTYIENQMTEALLRKCYKCNLKFIKEEGCNKMTCSCGAMMCYVCGEPVSDYKHFNGQGGDQHQLCPLYSDVDKLHQEAVLKGAKEAKTKLGLNEDPTKLKYDPTADLETYYADIKKRRKVAHNVFNNQAPLMMHYMNNIAHNELHHRHQHGHRHGHGRRDRHQQFPVERRPN